MSVELNIYRKLKKKKQDKLKFELVNLVKSDFFCNTSTLHKKIRKQQKAIQKE